MKRLSKLHHSRDARSWRAGAVFGLAFGLFVATAAEAVEAPEFYDGETIRFTTSNSPGGGFDQYMRLVAQHFEKATGVRTAGQNITGAGGVIGDNQLFMAEPDGLTVGLINFPGHVFNQLLNSEGVQYDFAEWEWLGRVAGVAPALAVRADSPIQTFQDAISSEEPIRFGLEGRGSDAFYGTVFLENLLGMPVEQIVGYGGPGEISAAMLAGEVDARFESVDTLLPEVEQGSIRVLVVFDEERDPRLPDVPSLAEIDVDAETREKLEAFANIYRLERSFVAPPGTPEDRVEFLREALMEVFQSEEFQADLEAAGRSLAPMSGSDLEAEAAKVASQVEELRPLFQEK
jgi:tripartite-type tricarboxylate transporter receptor subunit TctC